MKCQREQIADDLQKSHPNKSRAAAVEAARRVVNAGRRKTLHRKYDAARAALSDFNNCRVGFVLRPDWIEDTVKITSVDSVTGMKIREIHSYRGNL